VRVAIVGDDRARIGASRSRKHDENFDNIATFVLDSVIFSSIIYIWYEVVDLNPHVVTF
jgi:hypothetical protein